MNGLQQYRSSRAWMETFLQAGTFHLVEGNFSNLKGSVETFLLHSGGFPVASKAGGITLSSSTDTNLPS